MQRIEHILCCIECGADLSLKEQSFVCKHCERIYRIIDGIPRFVPESFYHLDNRKQSIEEKTKNYFGLEWDYFNDWGFIPDKNVREDQHTEFLGGTVSARVKAFDSKCRLNAKELGEGKIVLDAGCGNGRYTYEAAIREKGFVIGVDIGYGAVRSAYQNNKDNPNVIILQASLFNLPFKNNVFDSCFCNGVLMHTGDAEKAFYEVGRTIKNGGVYVVHVYHKLNPIFELNDRIIRFFTTRMSIENNLKFATVMKNLSRLIEKIPYALRILNLFFRLQSTTHHMFDWYSAPIATHHTYPEVKRWFYNAKFKIQDSCEMSGVRWYSLPWSLNIKGAKFV
jgi:SAM-dependent methyltransferase